MNRLLLGAFAGLVLSGGIAYSSSGPPARGQIAFGTNHLCRAKGPSGYVFVDCGRGEIAVVDTDGSHLRVLTHDTVSETDPVWSPDGREIAFLRPTRHGSDQIWVMNADGSGQRALTRFRTAPQLFGAVNLPAFSWSPDGLTIVFSAFPTRQGGRRQLYLLDVRSGGVSRLTRVATGATNPAWSPDGRWIAFVGDVAPDRIFLLSPRTHRVRALAARSGVPVAGLEIAWSPDSRWLAYNASGKLVAFDVRAKRFRRLARAGEAPSWSPDGRWIVFTSGNEVRLVRSDGSGARAILHVASQKTLDYEPAWRPR